MLRLKRGANWQDASIKPQLWIAVGIVYVVWKIFFYDDFMVLTEVFREGSGAHGRGEGFDLRRPQDATFGRTELFCKVIQLFFGWMLGVQLEPEWGKGSRYTGPHIHFQLKQRLDRTSWLQECD